MILADRRQSRVVELDRSGAVVDREAMLELVRLLLEHDAEPDVRTRESPPVRDYLLSITGTLEWVDFTGQTPFLTAALAGDGTVMRLLLEQNVLLQMQHLKTHPAVAKRLTKGDLTLHGWIYDIKTGDVSALDEAGEKFLPVDERYAKEMAALATGNSCAA